MTHVRRIILPCATTATLVAAVLAATPASATTAAAAPATSAPAPSAATSTDGGVTASSAAEQKRLERYWTKARLLSAIPLPDPADNGRQATTTLAGPTGKPGSDAPAAPKGEVTSARRIAESKVVGKVFFTKPSDGKRYTCSASAQNSPSKQLVITAGHCVHEGRGGTWMRNWVFIPRYRNGNRPFGTFAKKQFRTFNAWINDSSKQRDVAVVTTHRLNGRKLVNVVGGNGLSWNYPRNIFLTVVGYPGNRSNGQIQWYCQGNVRRVSIADPRIEIRCNFGGGSSGGPWVRAFNASTGRGNVNGVMSTIATGGWNRSSYFDTAVKTMKDAQGSVT